MASSITRSALSSASRVNYDFNRRICLMSFCRRLLTSPVLSTSAAPVDRGARGPRRSKRQADEPRSQRMSADQDWTSVYPTAGVFRPSAVPLPVRMGYPVKRGAPPEKTGNLELMKIPNFLHLTPVAIRKHCESLKQFCTDWPSALDTDQKSTEHFPIQIQSKEFVSSGPSLRNPKARIVTLQVKLSSLNLDDHARKKLIRLSGKRYCRDSDTLTITTDSCPLKQQNYDYAMYLLTVLYHESWKTEAWEQEKSRADMEEYEWEGSPSQQNLLESLVGIRGVEEAELLGRPEVQAYRDALVQLKNQGENHHNLLQYKEAVKKLLSI